MSDLDYTFTELKAATFMADRDDMKKLKKHIKNLKKKGYTAKGITISYSLIIRCLIRDYLSKQEGKK